MATFINESFGTEQDFNISDNGTDFNDSSQHDTFDYYVAPPPVAAAVLVIFGTVILVGIIGNILVLVVIACVKSMHNTVNRCLFSLALADLFILVVLPIDPIVDDFFESHIPLGKDFCNFLNMYDRSACVLSCLIFSYVTLDRYFALCRPLTSRDWWSGRKTYIILAVIWLISFALSIPYLYTSVYSTVDYQNTTYYFCYIDLDQTWMKWYDTIFNTVLYYVAVPVLLAFYGRMIYVIRRSSVSNKTETANEVTGNRARGQVVFMLLIVIVIYFVSQLPFATIFIFIHHFPKFISAETYDKKTFIVFWVSRILIFINSASNPVLYFSLSTKFRNGFVKVFSCQKATSSSSQSSTKVSSVISSTRL